MCRERGRLGGGETVRSLLSNGGVMKVIDQQWSKDVSEDGLSFKAFGRELRL